MPVIYDSNKIIPGPRITLRKEVNRSGDGEPRSWNYVISVKGQISATKGSPNGSGVFWTGSGYPPDENYDIDSRLRSIIKKQGALVELFERENKLFEVQPYDGTAPLKAIVKMRSITFDEGSWVDLCPYTIELDVIKLWFGNIEVDMGGTIDSTPPEETWSVESADEKERTYRVQHTVTATAKNQYDDTGAFVEKGWMRAKAIVLQALGISRYLSSLSENDFSATSATTARNTSIWTSIVSGLGTDTDEDNGSIFNNRPYNHAYSEQVDEAGGKYTLTESWQLYNPQVTGGVACLEDYVVSVRTSEDGRTRVSIEGTLTGLEERSDDHRTVTATRWENALARWQALEPTLYDICAVHGEIEAGGITLNTSTLGGSITKNIYNGVITFSKEYDNRPTLYAGAKSVVIQVSNSRAVDVYASIPVLGKVDGPVLQDIFTVTAKKRTLAIEIVMPVTTTTNPTTTQPDTDSMVAPFKPTGAKTDRDDESWSAETGRYSRQTSWTWV